LHPCRAVACAQQTELRVRRRTKRISVVTIVKRTGIGWFERMEKGITQFAAQNAVDATMIGADDADPQTPPEGKTLRLSPV
jgi:ABC-type sugar transport system substrate-binding protein